MRLNSNIPLFSVVFDGPLPLGAPRHLWGRCERRSVHRLCRQRSISGVDGCGKEAAIGFDLGDHHVVEAPFRAGHGC